jgi:cytoskeletal protein RodZ
MMKLKKVPKKTVILFIGILILTGCVLAMVLNYQKTDEKNADDAVTSAAVSSQISEISVAPIIPSSDASNSTTNDTEPSKISPAFDPTKESSRSEPLTTSSKTTSTPPKPVIVGDSENGSQPTNPALTEKNHKPTYTSKPTVTSESNSSKSTNSAPSGGKPGQVYDLVFGWHYPTGGTGTTVEGDWGEGPQVGIMD